MTSTMKSGINKIKEGSKKPRRFESRTQRELNKWDYDNEERFAGKDKNYGDRSSSDR